MSDALARFATQGGSSARVGAAVASAWQQIDGCLSPVIGKRGVAALYQRSLELTLPAHPWLAPTHRGVATFIDIATIDRVVGEQAPSIGAAGGGAVLDLFRDMLAEMVGVSLTEELLGSVGVGHSDNVTPSEKNP